MSKISCFLGKLASLYLNVSFSKHGKCLNTWNSCLFRLSFLGESFYMFFRRLLKIKKTVDKHFFFPSCSYSHLCNWHFFSKVAVQNFVFSKQLLFFFQLNDSNGFCWYHFFKISLSFLSLTILLIELFPEMLKCNFVWKRQP